MKRLLIVMSLIGLCLLFAISVGTAQAEAIHITLKTGVCGPNASWEIWKNADNVITLEVSGSGAMTEPVVIVVPGATPPPYSSYVYSEYYRSTTRIIVNEGITAICANGFEQFYRVEEIELPTSCEVIGSRAFYADYLTKLSLPEGLRIIAPYALVVDDWLECLVTVIPKSVVEIGEGALEGIVPAVWSGTEGENYCLDWGITNYILLDATTDDSLRAHKLALIDAMAQVEDVPTRYRMPAVVTLNRMNLTADQCDALRDYVLREEQALKLAMVDNSMSAAEIMGFMGRFVAMMNEIGVETHYEINTFSGQNGNDYPGVSLTATVNGEDIKLDVYRTGYHTWRVRNLGFMNESDFSYAEIDGGVMITGYHGSETDLTFPATLGGKPVISISGVDTDDYPEGLTSVTIPEGVKRIESRTLRDQESLTSLTLPDSLEVIGDYAFGHCLNLTEIHFGSNLREIRRWAFSYTGVTSLTFPDSLEVIGDYAFGHCLILTDIHFGSNLHEIRRGAFSDTGITSLTFPDSLEVIGDYAFGHCLNLTDIHFGSHLREISGEAFSDTGVTSLTFPDSLEVIGDWAFDDCNDLTEIHFGSNLRVLGNAFQYTGVTSVSLPASLETLGRSFDYIDIDPANPHFQSDQGALYNLNTNTLIQYSNYGNSSYTVLPGTQHIAEKAFAGNMYIHTIILPEGLIDIGNQAFYNCQNLSSINLPDSIESIGNSAFYNAPLTQFHVPSRLFSGSEWDYIERNKSFFTGRNLFSLLPIGWNMSMQYYSVGEGNRFFSARNGVLFSADGSELLSYPAQRTGASYAVPTSTKLIAASAVVNNKSLQLVMLPDGLKEIGNYAFGGCNNLTSINLPDSLTSLGYHCFEYTRIQPLTIPEGIKHLPALGLMYSLESLTLPSSLIDWDSENWYSLLPSLLEIRGYRGSSAEVFANENDFIFEAIEGGGVESITLDTQRIILMIGDEATISAHVTGGSANTLSWREQTESMTGLIDFTVQNGAEAIFRAVRPGKTTLVAAAGQAEASCTVEVLLPEQADEGLAVLPDDLAVIGPSAFAGAAIRYLVIPGGVTSIGSRAFYRCEALRIVQIPDTVTNIASNAFDGCSQFAFLCGTNSYAAAYAETHDIPWYAKN